MSIFAIEPYVGALPVRFDMSKNDVAAILGAPSRSSTDSTGDVVEDRQSVSIGYSHLDNKVFHIGFGRRATVTFKDRNIFDHPDLISFLLESDPEPYEVVGFLVFFKLGIATSGFHDEDEAQKGIAVFKSGRWDEFRSEAIPFNKLAL